MKQWYVKDLSKITGVSVQTLHHYDRINLLKPNIRLSNGYRVYCESDLLRLQQIIALKFFGFELSQIKQLLSGDINAQEHFKEQANILEKQAYKMLDASNNMKSAISRFRGNDIPWETIIKLIEVYNMTKQLEHSWVKEIFTNEELKQYAEFETELKSNPKVSKAEFEKRWHALLAEISDNLSQDPRSEIGITLGKKSVEWVNSVYGKKHANLRTKKFEQGFGEGKGLKEVGLTKDMVDWMDKAMNAYWFSRAYSILDQVSHAGNNDLVLKLWNEFLDDIYGDQDERKPEIYDVAISDPNISEVAKNWLRSIKKSK